MGGINGWDIKHTHMKQFFSLGSVLSVFLCFIVCLSWVSFCVFMYYWLSFGCQYTGAIDCLRNDHTIVSSATLSSILTHCA